MILQHKKYTPSATLPDADGWSTTGDVSLNSFVDPYLTTTPNVNPATALEFDTVNGYYNSCCQIDDTHFINFWWGDTGGRAQVFTFNYKTWEVTAAGAVLTFEASTNTQNSCCKIDDTHVINFWGGVDNDGFVQVFEINTTTWAITAMDSPLEFDVDQGLHHSCCKIDDTHVINFWAGALGGMARVFEIDSTTFAVTGAGAALNFDAAGFGYFNSCSMIDATHVIDFWAGASGDGYVQTFSINTTTWAITAIGTSLEFDTTNGYYNSCYQIDDEHFINFWAGTGSDGFAQVFFVNDSTYVVSKIGTALEFDTSNGEYNSCSQIDQNHYINFWQGSDGDGFVQAFEVNMMTWAVSALGSPLEFDTSNCIENSCYKVSSNHFINFWGGADDDGFAQVFTVDKTTWAVTKSGIEEDLYYKAITVESSDPVMVDFSLLMTNGHPNFYLEYGPRVKVCNGSYNVMFSYLKDEDGTPQVGFIINDSTFSSVSIQHYWDDSISDYFIHDWRIVVDPKFDRVRLIDKSSGNVILQQDLSSFVTTTDKFVAFGNAPDCDATISWKYIYYNVGVGFIRQFGEFSQSESGDKIYMRGNFDNATKYKMTVDGHTCYSHFDSPNIVAKSGRCFGWTSEIGNNKCDLRLEESSTSSNYVLFEDEIVSYFSGYHFSNSRIENKKHFPQEIYSIKRRTFADVEIVGIESFVNDPCRLSFVVSADDMHNKLDLFERSNTPDRGDAEVFTNIHSDILNRKCLVMVNGMAYVCSIDYDETDPSHYYLSINNEDINLISSIYFNIGDSLSIYANTEIETAVYKITFGEASNGYIDLHAHVPTIGDPLVLYEHDFSVLAEDTFVFLNGVLQRMDTALAANRAGVSTDCALSGDKTRMYFSNGLTLYGNDILSIVRIPSTTRGEWLVSAAEEAAEEIDLAAHTADRLTHIDISPTYDGDGNGFYHEILIFRNGIAQIVDEDERANVLAVVDDVAKKTSDNNLCFPDIEEDDLIVMAKI